MQDVLGIEDNALSWAGLNFIGGLTRHREGVCGAVSAMAVCTGFLHRHFTADLADNQEEKEKIRVQSFQLAQAFKDEFGTLICRELLGLVDMNEQEMADFFAQKKYWEQCNDYVRFAVTKLYELEDKENEI
ncbi:MAG: C_GCAxxG_C_C family protein [Dehalococcoidales bacterium]|nr:C_GCAxxG_C_C family protein [Dehalococcoidales bacterium]